MAAPIFVHDEDARAMLAGSTMPRFRRHACDGQPCDESTLRSWQASIKARQGGASNTARSCAVVGNSGSLVSNVPRGRLIDAHDWVFRVNDAPVAGYERFVGARTTYRVWGSIPLPWRRADWNESNATTLLIYCQPSKWLSQCWTSIPTHPHPRISPLLWHRVRTRVREKTQRSRVGTFPSTGLVAIWVALRLCERVTIYGFGNGSFDCTRRRQTVCSRYYGNALLTLRDRHWCALPREEMPFWRQEDYVRQSTFHDFEMEREWIGATLAGSSSDPSHGRLQRGACPLRRGQRWRAAKRGGGGTAKHPE